MLALERQESIIDQVNRQGSVKVKDLSVMYEVTEDCIRKDLSLLEKKGALKKTYGGAVRIKENPHMYKSIDRSLYTSEERMTIAKKAIRLLEENDTIFLDVSVSSIEIAKLIQISKINLTVISNMVEVLNVLSNCSHVSMIFVGGELNDEGDGFWGTLSSQMIKSFKIDKAFLGVVGVDYIKGQLSTYHIDDGVMKNEVLKQSIISYVLCEKRKFSEYGNYVFASLEDVSGIILSKIPNESIKISLEEFNLLII